MDIYELAKKLDGRKYKEEITTEEEKIAKDNGLIIVFGYSDDCCEFRGCIDDEVGCYDGGKYYINKDLEVYDNTNECEDISNSISVLLTIIWNDTEYPCFEYKIDIPCAEFNIMEDGNIYCKGIVFHKDSIIERL
jgi:hypothetical protein